MSVNSRLSDEEEGSPGIEESPSTWRARESFALSENEPDAFTQSLLAEEKEAQEEEAEKQPPEPPPLPTAWEQALEKDILKIFSHLLERYSRNRMAVYSCFGVLALSMLLVLCLYPPLQAKIFGTELEWHFRFVLVASTLSLSALRLALVYGSSAFTRSFIQPEPGEMAVLVDRYRECLRSRLQERMAGAHPHHDDEWEATWAEAVRDVSRPLVLRDIRDQFPSVMERRRGNMSMAPHPLPPDEEGHVALPERAVASALAESVMKSMCARKDLLEKAFMEACTTFFGAVAVSPNNYWLLGVAILSKIYDSFARAAS